MSGFIGGFVSVKRASLWMPKQIACSLCWGDTPRLGTRLVGLLQGILCRLPKGQPGVGDDSFSKVFIKSNVRPQSWVLPGVPCPLNDAPLWYRRHLRCQHQLMDPSRGSSLKFVE